MTAGVVTRLNLMRRCSRKRMLWQPQVYTNDHNTLLIHVQSSMHALPTTFTFAQFQLLLYMFYYNVSYIIIIHHIYQFFECAGPKKASPAAALKAVKPQGVFSTKIKGRQTNEIVFQDHPNYNERFTKILSQMETIQHDIGLPHKAKAYRKAVQALRVRT